ncbi:MAG: ergothioneine biosynthesis protein EgtB [Deltaproteobacteria bacterium]|nr:ergothioneine biosynthesis protein EgtB [Deltaproteobacteria bacterium]
MICGQTQLMTSPELAARYRHVRDRTLALCAPLSSEDAVVQPMPDASPAKWHLAHTTWFFEAFVLSNGPRFDETFEALFNSYYEAVGPRVERARRGQLTRPDLARVRAYRAHVDARVLAGLVEGALDDAALGRLELGLHHEQQHQELILTDLKYTLGTQPLAPAYRHDLPRVPHGDPWPLSWQRFGGGVVTIGATDEGFAFDNERPRHDVIVRPFELARRPVCNAEVLAFIADGGYRDHRWWLSDGWQLIQRDAWRAPLYWDGSQTYELAGVRAIEPAETACHLSYYEADAIARWLGGRLPTEAEWELATTGIAPEQGNFADDDRLHPDRASTDGDGPAQLFGDVWEWTASSYSPYPGFQSLPGALGEYNGKFMSGQQVLRGGSCFTPRSHIRATYRNFFPPSARWQMTGMRIARDA